MQGLRIVSLVLGLTALLPGGLPASERDPAAEIKAAYIYNFARFVQWPKTAFAAHPAEFLLCTLDSKALDGNLLRIGGREAQGFRVTVRTLRPGDDASSCQILFLPRELNGRRNGWVQTLAPSPVLTISDDPSFVRERGMIALYVANDRVQFAINREVAETAGLTVGARLLTLAQDAPEAAE